MSWREGPQAKSAFQEAVALFREIFERLGAKGWLRKIEQPGACASPGS